MSEVRLDEISHPAVPDTPASSFRARRLNLDSELTFVADSNSVVPKGGSNWDGLELAAFWNPLEWLAADAVYATDEVSKDIVYFYETNVAGLGPDEARVSRAKEPRTYRIGFKYSF